MEDKEVHCPRQLAKRCICIQQHQDIVINGACLPTMQTQMYTISSVSRQQHTNAVYKALKVHSILAYACVAILRMMCHVLTK